MTYKVALLVMFLAWQTGHNVTLPSRKGPPYVNRRDLMQGARCNLDARFDPKGNLPQGPYESQFGDLKSIEVSKTADSESWVVSMRDFDGCRLSFWAESGELNKEIIVRAISSY